MKNIKVATVPQLTDWFMFKKEQTFLICDEATRRTGKLIKTVVLNDATGVRPKKKSLLLL